MQKSMPLKYKLASKYWRLNNLYVIVDKNSQERVLKLNRAQQIQYSIPHNKDITLKSRQQGISTYKVAENLDKCIVIPNYQAGIQSYGQKESQKLYLKALKMWEKLPKSVKKYFNIELKSASMQFGFQFSNGSSLRIGNFRGDTLQSLHVSELAKIAVKYPDKALELKTGAFEAVSTKNTISIESTAEGATGMFYEMWNQAVEAYKTRDRLTPLDFYPVFLSWVIDPDCYLDVPVKFTKEDLQYFEEVEEFLKNHPEYRTYPVLDEFGIVKKEVTLSYKLTPEQKYWASVKRRNLGEYFNREYPYSPDVAFKLSLKGTFFKDQYERILLEKERTQPIGYKPGYPVYVSFDIGVRDYTVLLFSQLIPKNELPLNIQKYIPESIKRVPVIFGEFFTNATHGVGYYANVIRKYKDDVTQLEILGDLKYCIFPHDGKSVEWTTGETRISQIMKEGLPVFPLKDLLSFTDSIQIARVLLNYTVFSNTPNLLIAVQSYKRKFDSTNQVYLETDVHDIHSDFIASYRYLMQYYSYTRLIYKD